MNFAKSAARYSQEKHSCVPDLEGGVLKQEEHFSVDLIFRCAEIPNTFQTERLNFCFTA